MMSLPGLQDKGRIEEATKNSPPAPAWAWGYTTESLVDRIRRENEEMQARMQEAMERSKRVRSHYRVQYIPLEEMFTS